MFLLHLLNAFSVNQFCFKWFFIIIIIIYVKILTINKILSVINIII